MSYELNDVKLHKIIKKVETPTGFKKIEFVIKTDEQYPQLIKFEVQNDKCGLIDNIFPEDRISFSFNIRGREWISPDGKLVFFTTFVVWKLNKIENGYRVPTNDNSPHVQHGFNFPPAEQVFGKEIDDDDLPF